MMRKRGRLVLMVFPLWVVACTWVPLTQEGSHVELRSFDQVQGCERKSRVTTSVKAKVGGVSRSEEKVRGELLTLARNEAGRIGGNAVVAETEPTDGRQAFIVYRCP